MVLQRGRSRQHGASLSRPLATHRLIRQFSQHGADHRDVSIHEAVESARGDHLRKAAREAKGVDGGECAEEPDEEDRLAPDAVAQRAPEEPGEELHEREERLDEAGVV